MPHPVSRSLLLAGLLLLAAAPVAAQVGPDGLIPRFAMEASGPVLARPTQAGAFFDVVGRRAALFGYENRPFEAWVYPLKLVHDAALQFRIADYPVAIDGPEAMTAIEVRPEATVVTYTHAAFTVRQIMYAPVDESGVIVLLDVDAVRPLTIAMAFRPDLSLMWPAGLMTNALAWEPEAGRYLLLEETGRFAGVVGSPLARDVSIQPYQEEPQDLPTRFEMHVTPEQAARGLVPVVMAGSVEGPDAARAAYDRLLEGAEALYAANVAHYRALLASTMAVDTPDDRLDVAYDWARVGIDKGLATNPTLGTGLVAGYRTAGNSERPGFAWFFGRDALWTAFATTAYGDAATTRTALDFLRQFQRDDGKVPHEISQSAALLDWFTDYSYPWNSADATPLYVIVHRDLYDATGDRAYLEAAWPSLRRAYAWTAATDTDGDGLMENYNRPDGPDFGHGWVEGGALYPGHEEIYLQGLFVEAAESMAVLAEAMGDDALAREARADAERVRRATEATYWIDDAGYYAFSTRQDDAVWAENTALQAVPLWWGLLDADRAQRALDHLGSGALATDWGARILSAESAEYDPLSYHNGSVWPLFTGWASMGAYAYDRADVGYQALLASALLTEQDALGYVTELLSGDYNTAFGRSSHHQVWSEAMVATPLVRGMLGLDVRDGGRTLVAAPQLPADWDVVRLRRVPAGGGTVDLTWTREADALRAVVEAEEGADGTLVLSPALPLDARVTAVEAGGEALAPVVERGPTAQRVRVEVPLRAGAREVVFRMEPGTQAYVRHEAPAPGAVSTGLRLLRQRAADGVLTLVLEGRGGRTYDVYVRTPHALTTPADVVQEAAGDGVVRLRVPFGEAASASGYVRRTLRMPLE